MRKVLLFVTYGGGHAHMIYPVVHALRETGRKDIDIRVLGLPAAKSILVQNGVECFNFMDYLDEKKDADAIAWGTELAKIHHSPTIGVTREESIAYLGLNYKDLVIRLGKEEAARQFAKKARNAFYPLTIMERIFDDIRPHFVATTNSPRSEAAAIATANARGIDNLIMTDLFSGWIIHPLKARHITFLNEFAKNRMIQDGLIDPKNSRFYCTGNPAFDKTITLSRDKDPAWIRRHFPQAAGGNIVLHADMPAYTTPDTRLSYFKTEKDFLEELDACYHAAMENDAVYLVRPHPSQDRAPFTQWLKGKKNAWLAADCDLYALLANIDLLVVRSTTVGVTAACMGKRIVQLDPHIHLDIPLAKMGLAWGANNYKELSGVIKNALSNDKELEEIRHRTQQMLPNEPAAPKIANIIEMALA